VRERWGGCKSGLLQQSVALRWFFALRAAILVYFSFLPLLDGFTAEEKMNIENK
jgi:hypothetical protein